MTKKSAAKPLTELEGATLAIIAREGPMTPYSVKESFRNSPSEFWSGSAGAVYPLLNRLEARGLITQTPDVSDGRARRECAVTAAGRAELKIWLMDAERASALGFDPLRTRLFFSELLNAAEKKKFLTAVSKKLDDAVAAATDVPPPMIVLQGIWTQLRRDALKAFVAKKKS